MSLPVIPIRFMDTRGYAFLHNRRYFLSFTANGRFCKHLSFTANGRCCKQLSCTAHGRLCPRFFPWVNLLLISATALAGMVQKTMKQRLPKMHEPTADANAENVSNRSRPIVQSVWLAMACPAKPCVAVGPRVRPRVGPQV